MAIRASIVLATLAVALTALPASAEARGCADAHATTAHASKRKIVRATLCELNQVRVRYHLHHLRLNKKLSRAARRHARDMARRNYFSHDTLGGGSFLDRIRAPATCAARTAGSSARTSPGAARATAGPG